MRGQCVGSPHVFSCSHSLVILHLGKVTCLGKHVLAAHGRTVGGGRSHVIRCSSQSLGVLWGTFLGRARWCSLACQCYPLAHFRTTMQNGTELMHDV